MTETSDKEMHKWWGPRCDEFDHECPVCCAWAMFDKSGEVPDTEDVQWEMDHGK